MSSLLSPGVSVSVTDAPVGQTSGQGTIPLILMATAANKLVPDGSAIAPGTQTSGSLYLSTSQTDLLNQFGNPYFEVNQGTVNQGGEINEYGLHAAFSYLSIANQAYVIRADIDLGQLAYQEEPPTAAPTNGTYWFNTASTSWGLFQNNGNATPGLAWNQVTVLQPTTAQLTGSVPSSSFGVAGNVAVVTETTNNAYYENIGGAWYLIGSASWSAARPTIATGTVHTPTFSSSTTIILDGITCTTTSTTLAQTIIDINGTSGISALGLTASNVGGYLTITDSNGLNITATGAVATAAGLAATTYGYHIFYDPHYSIPTGKVVGDWWIKTTNPNYGANYVVELYSTQTGQWSIVTAPFYATDALATAGYGSALATGSLYVDFNSALTIATGTATSPTLTPTTTLIINGNTVTLTGTTVASAVVNINAAAITGIVASGTTNLVLTNSVGGALVIAGTAQATLGFSTVYLPKATQVIRRYSGSAWATLTYTASATAPTNSPAAGTLWISNESFQVDIMVNTGNQWHGYKNVYSSTDASGVQITSAEPTTQANGDPLVANDLWLNSGNQLAYPELYVWNAISLEWVLIDLTDHTTPFGIVFHDARNNSDGTQNGATTAAAMLASNYVDPDAPNPEVYPAGILLFNTRFSNNNVKSWTPNYLTGYGAGYSVGTATFPAPTYLDRWVTASGNNYQGIAYFGRFAQHIMVVNAFNALIEDTDSIKSEFNFFNLIATPGYPELDLGMMNLNVSRKETAFIINDVPLHLPSSATALQNWATNVADVPGTDEFGRVLQYTYSAEYYPHGLGVNSNGLQVVIPSSTIALVTYAYNDSVAYPWVPPAGTQRGVVQNASSVGYVDPNTYQYVPVILNQGQRDTLFENDMNPIAFLPNRGLVVYGDKTLDPTDNLETRVNVARLVCFLRYQLDQLAQPFLFQLNTPTTWTAVESVFNRFFGDLMAVGAVTDFVVVCSSENNSPSTIALNQLWIDVGCVPSQSIDFIYIPLRIQSSLS